MARRVEHRTSRGLITDEATSARLGRIRQRGTLPELAVRRIVSSFGARFTTSNRDLPGSPDLANRRRGWAIFVHGCYWHSHEGCPRATIPTRNRSFWEEKFTANRARDRKTIRELRRAGFRTLVVWECETKSESMERKLRRFFSSL
jgi:DNA mismatch endonuclease (patch repair protein)